MIRLAIRCDAADADPVLAELTEIAPAGFEVIEAGEVTEFAIYGAPGELPDLGGALATVGGVEVTVCSTEVGDDWADRWRDFHTPVEIAGKVRIRPPWEVPAGELLDLVIDPGRAFGTAAHPTTRMCAELLLEGRHEGPLVDLGTGSGVLAILAARLGFGPVLGVDHERVALEVAAANAAANGVEIGLERVDLRRERPPVPAGATVVANLTADLLVPLAPAIAATAPTAVIFSGVLPAQRAEVEAAFSGAGMEIADSREFQGWTSGRAVRISP